MKKQTVTIAALLLLPLMVVLVASNSSGVTVFDGETVRMVSWFQTVPESPWGWCAPVAGLMNYVLFALAVIFGLTKKNWCLKGIFGISFAAMCIAVLPIVMQHEIMIVPNVLGAILLGAESMGAYLAMKKPEQAAKDPKPIGERLEKH